jgi:hypothetical protein
LASILTFLSRWINPYRICIAKIVSFVFDKNSVPANGNKLNHKLLRVFECDAIKIPGYDDIGLLKPEL